MPISDLLKRVLGQVPERSQSETDRKFDELLARLKAKLDTKTQDGNPS